MKRAKNSSKKAVSRSLKSDGWIRFSVQTSQKTFSNLHKTLHIIATYQEESGSLMTPVGVPNQIAELFEKLRKSGMGAGQGHSQILVRFGGPAGVDSVLFVPAGKKSSVDSEKLRQAGGLCWSRVLAEKFEQAVVHVDSFTEVSGLKSEGGPIEVIRSFGEGMALAAYDYPGLKTDSASKRAKTQVDAVFLCLSKKIQSSLETALQGVSASAIAVRLTRDWSNLPSNLGTPTYYAEKAVETARRHGLKARVLTESEVKKEKMGLLLGVGQGSEQEVRVVVVEHQPSQGRKKLCFVGKGITFDSGGISIKPSLRMEDMKHDMTGAATVMGATLLASLWGAKNHVIAVMAFAENMPDGNAINPGNVLTSRSGKTVEVINTDAEGRLILADALDFAQDFKPDAIVDVATLTGAVSVALGRLACAILGTDDSFNQQVIGAGKAVGEKIWELPLWDEYFDDLKSDVADMKNSANDGNGGTIRGAIFMKQFIKKGQVWAHLDIASTAYGVSHLHYMPKKGASGLYVRTLARLALDY